MEWVQLIAAFICGAVVAALILCLAVASRAEPVTTTPTSKVDLSAADYEKLAWVMKMESGAGPAATNPGNGLFNSPPRTQASPQSPGQATWGWCGHVANCSSCQESPAALRSLSRMLAQVADVLPTSLASTSLKEDMSSSAASGPGSATSGSNQCIETLGLLDGVPRRCLRELGHRGWHAADPRAVQFVEMLS